MLSQTGRRRYLSLGAPFLLDTAWRRTNSICALTLRKSSAAHFSSSFKRSGGILRRNGLRCSDDTSGVQGAGIDDGGGIRVAAQYDQQIADHRSLAFVVQLHHI